MFRGPILRITFLNFFALSAVAFSEPEKPASNQSGDLLAWISGKDHPGARSGVQAALLPQWIGTVETTFSRDPHGTSSKEKPDAMRLNKIWRDKKGRVVIARAGRQSFSGRDAAVFQKELPTLAELQQATQLTELRQWFGPQHGITDGWGDGKEMHWSNGWTYFTILKDGRLRWLHVFALVAGPRDGVAENGKIESLTVREGFFRVADPASNAEKLAYPSADELAAASEAARAAERAKIPQPLRTLVSARQKQGDSDLLAYTEAINAIRSDPKPELFAQMAERIDDGTSEMRGMVEAVLCDDTSPNYGAPWNLTKKHLALRHAASAIDHIKTREGLEKWSQLLLQAIGGGHLQPKRQDGTLWIDMKVKVEGNSKSTSVGGNRITDETLVEAKRAVREEFVRNFPILKPE